MSQEYSLTEKILTWLVFAVIFGVAITLAYLAYKYFWPNKFDPNNLWYQQYDPEVFCKNFVKGTLEYLDCQEAAYMLAERRAENIGY